MAHRKGAGWQDPDEKTRTEVSVEGSRAAALQEAEERHEQSRGRRNVAILVAVSAVVLLVAWVLPEGMGRQSTDVTSLSVFLERLTANFGNLAAVFANTHTAGNYEMVVCRYAAAFVTGAVLGSCGAVYQTSFRNPLASPSTLGVVSGCLLGSVAFFLFLYDGWVQASLNSLTTALSMLDGLNPLQVFWVVYGRSVCAVLGGFAVVGIALAVARIMGGGSLNNIVLVVFGSVFALVADSFVDTVRYYLESSGQVERATLVQLAEGAPFANITNFANLAMVAVPLVAGLIVLLLMRTRMNVLGFSDEEAQSMGVDITRYRTGVVLLCTAITGISVGFCGPISFVGFLCPHIARRLVPVDMRYQLPASMFIGATFLTIALAATYQMDIGAFQGVNLITTSLGCVVFLIVAFRSRGGTRAWS